MKKMRILLATDGSDYSKIAVRELKNWILPPNTEVHIISAFENPVLIMSAPLATNSLAPTYGDAEIMVQKFAENAVEDAAKLLTDGNSNLLISTAAIKGSPKHVILEEADRFGADLIVVGSHGHGGIGRFLLGSVSQSVALHAKCSVEIVRKPEQ